MLPIVRTIISSPAGLLKMGMARFFLWSAAGTAVWSSALAIAGYFLGSQFKEIERIIGPLSTAVILMIVVIYIWRQLTWRRRSEEHTSELQSLMRISYAVFCLKKKTKNIHQTI